MQGITELWGDVQPDVKRGYVIVRKNPNDFGGGNLFNMYRLRSITNDRDKNGALKPDSVRMTKFLRSTSLDELPKLWN
jgi:undecaprenyl phosphate N,N'-diacetylbacillosamine 1-phosphate transferase